MTRLRRFLRLLPRQLRRQKLLVALARSRLVEPAQLLEFNGGARAFVDLRDPESRAIYLSQTFWPEFHPMLAAFLRGGGDFFDVGANFGLVSFGVVPHVSGLGTGFHLFEANPVIVPLLERSAGLWPDERFVVSHGCVTDRPGVSKLTLSDRAWGHAFIGERGVPVPNLVLDDYIARMAVERIAFLKMDVEGWEPRALRGTERSLVAGKVAAVFVEVEPETLSRAGHRADALLRMLEGYGFDLYFCALWDHPDPHGLEWMRVPVNGTTLRFARATPLPATYVSGDVLAIHRTTDLAGTLRGALKPRG